MQREESRIVDFRDERRRAERAGIVQPKRVDAAARGSRVSSDEDEMTGGRGHGGKGEKKNEKSRAGETKQPFQAHCSTAVLGGQIHRETLLTAARFSLKWRRHIAT